MTGLPIYDRVMDDLTRPFHHHPYQPHYDATNTPPPEAPVSLLDDIRNEFSRAVTWTEDEFRAALPTVAKAADYADAVAQSGPAKAILDAVLSPADEAVIVGLVQRLDQSVHQAEQNVQAAALADAEPPPDAAMAGPVVGGQA